MQNKKRLLIIIISLVIICIIILAILLLFPKTSKNVSTEVKEIISKTEEDTTELENKFFRMFANINYPQENEEIITDAYTYEGIEVDKYDVRAHIPKFTFETCNNINTEIVKIFAQKLVNVVKYSNVNTKYIVDYKTYINDNIISLIIKCTLKEGNNPERSIIKTYNYDVNNEKILRLEDIIEDKDLNREEVQNKVNTKIKGIITNKQQVIDKGYNIYKRDLNSEEYLIENIENFFLDEEKNLYIIFPYGNLNNTTETDVIVFK